MFSTTDARRANMTLYTDSTCVFGHQARLVIEEKSIEAEIEEVIEGHWPEDVIAANPYGVGPTLIDRDLVLFDAKVIMDYFDERFPHPPLMPVDPVARAQSRLMLHRLQHDWFSHWDILMGSDKTKSNRVRKTIREDLTVLAPIFDAMPFFMGKEISLLDCTLAPLLWRLPMLNIKLPTNAKPVLDYAERIFARDAFQASLTEAEREMR